MTSIQSTLTSPVRMILERKLSSTSDLHTGDLKPLWTDDSCDSSTTRTFSDDGDSGFVACLFPSIGSDR
jgi:hypothetical protein